LNPLQIQIKQSYYIRMTIIVMLALIPGLIIASLGIPNQPLFILIGLTFGCLPPALIYFQRMRWVKSLDDVGVTRQDGKKFPWAEFLKVDHIHASTKSGTRYLSHIEIKFKTGKALIFPLVLNNLTEILKALETVSNKEAKQLK
jgi:hypothetical protein